MEDLDDIFEEDAEADHEDLQKFIENLNRLSKEAGELDDKALELETKAKELRKQSEVLRFERMPYLMEKIRMNEVTTPEGQTLKLRDSMKGSIPAERKGQAHQWLRDQGFGTLVKNQVSVQLGKGEDEKAQEIREFFQTLGIPFELKESVHPQTLNAFIREQREKGVNLPEDLFNVFERKEVKIGTKK